jgi:hypothetical protein
MEIDGKKRKEVREALLDGFEPANVLALLKETSSTSICKTSPR